MNALLSNRSARFSWLLDAAIVAAAGALIYGLVDVGREWSGELRPVVEIDLSPWALPHYAMLTLFRGVAAYFLSLGFTLIYGRVAAYNPRAEKVMVPLLDILQSIPVLGFLPGLVLALVALFPRSNLGLELACVLMIFTGQVWNMTFSFYHSLQTIPSEMRDAARVYRLSAWQRFTQLELPYSAVGLVWNSMMSMAGGWFFLTVTEAFVLGDKDFRLPGIGSYMSVAIAEGNVPAMIYGIVAMVAMVVAVDQFIWRPIVAWSHKFKFEETEAAERPTSFVLSFIQRSQLLAWVNAKVWSRLVTLGQPRVARAASATNQNGDVTGFAARRVFSWLFVAVLLAGVTWGAIRFIQLIAQLDGASWLRVGELTGLTFVRVLAAVVLGTLWTVPVGVAIGLSPKVSRLLQPVIQVLASFPAPMVYPLVLMGLSIVGVTLNYGSVALIMLGTQWYILFNVIAGAMALPQDLREAGTIYRLTGWLRWRKLILPGIFPYLVTGWVTATGGAWNASIVAEYVHFGKQELVATGLGSTISVATDRGDFPLLAASVLAMCVAVVVINRVVWKKLYRYAEDRFALNK
jgi:NitT/TauT family transport system permease protein